MAEKLALGLAGSNPVLTTKLCIMKEQVCNPVHYNSNGIEAIDVIDAFNLNFNLGNAIKYILRSERKGNKKTDLEKCVWYLNREIDKLNG